MLNIKAKKKNLINDQLSLGEQFNYQYLTKRETEVLKYIVLGYTAKKIGQQLNISYRTVEAYIELLKLKLNCYSKGQLASVVITSGLIHELGLL
jgi:DNA-binding NarL/FixJ family response regulator